MTSLSIHQEQYPSTISSTIQSSIQQLRYELQKSKAQSKKYIIQLTTLQSIRSKISHSIQQLSDNYKKQIKTLEHKLNKLEMENQLLIKKNSIYQISIQNYQKTILEKDLIISNILSQNFITTPKTSSLPYTKQDPRSSLPSYTKQSSILPQTQLSTPLFKQNNIQQQKINNQIEISSSNTDGNKLQKAGNRFGKKFQKEQRVPKPEVVQKQQKQILSNQKKIQKIKNQQKNIVNGQSIRLDSNQVQRNQREQLDEDKFINQVQNKSNNQQSIKIEQQIKNDTNRVNFVMQKEGQKNDQNGQVEDNEQNKQQVVMNDGLEVENQIGVNKQKVQQRNQKRQQQFEQKEQNQNNFKNPFDFNDQVQINENQSQNYFHLHHQSINHVITHQSNQQSGQFPMINQNLQNHKNHHNDQNHQNKYEKVQIPSQNQQANYFDKQNSYNQPIQVRQQTDINQEDQKINSNQIQLHNQQKQTMPIKKHIPPPPLPKKVPTSVKAPVKRNIKSKNIPKYTSHVQYEQQVDDNFIPKQKQSYHINKNNNILGEFLEQGVQYHQGEANRQRGTNKQRQNQRIEFKQQYLANRQNIANKDNNQKTNNEVNRQIKQPILINTNMQQKNNTSNSSVNKSRRGKRQHHKPAQLGVISFQQTTTTVPHQQIYQQQNYVQSKVKNDSQFFFQNLANQHKQTDFIQNQQQYLNSFTPKKKGSQDDHQMHGLVDQSSIQQIQDTSMISNPIFPDQELGGQKITKPITKRKGSMNQNIDFPSKVVPPPPPPPSNKMSKKKTKREVISMIDPKSFL